MNHDYDAWVPTYDFAWVTDPDLGSISAMYMTATGEIVSTVGLPPGVTR